MKVQKSTGSQMDTITYNFEDGSKQSQPINEEVFTDFKGRKKHRNEIFELFQQTAWDRKAVSFSIDAEVSEEEVIAVEPNFTRKERKDAVKDYKDFIKQNAEGFYKLRNKFRAEFNDKLVGVRKLKFNLRPEGFSFTA